MLLSILNFMIRKITLYLLIKLKICGNINKNKILTINNNNDIFQFFYIHILIYFRTKFNFK